MARGKTTHSLHQQEPRVPCPNCGKRYADVLRHLNHRNSKCANWFSLPPPSTTFSSPQLPAFAGDAPPSPTGNPEPSPIYGNLQTFRTEFPNAGEVYGRGKSFMDRFNDDTHTPHRADNPHYPFADQEEWELASFLLRSGLSMQKVDEFLRLKLVFHF